MLGSTDPVERDEIAYPILATWISEGVYDDLLRRPRRRHGRRAHPGGSGEDEHRLGVPAQLLRAGAGRVHRARQRRVAGCPPRRSCEWGDRIAAGWCASATSAGSCPDKGWAHAVAHGADAIGALADSPHFGLNELTVLLDVIADRVRPRDPGPALQRRARPAGAGDDGACCGGGWCRCGSSSRGCARHHRGRDRTPRPAEVATRTCVSGNPEAFLRALHLQLALAPEPIDVRADLLLELVDALRATNADYLRARRADRPRPLGRPRPAHDRQTIPR